MEEPVDATVMSVYYYQIVHRHISQNSDRPAYNHCNERFQKGAITSLNYRIYGVYYIS